MVVFTADGSEFQAEHVIFTPSLGVLKTYHESIFDPALPEKKREAIEVRNCGTVFISSQLIYELIYFRDLEWEIMQKLLCIGKNLGGMTGQIA